MEKIKRIFTFLSCAAAFCMVSASLSPGKTIPAVKYQIDSLKNAMYSDSIFDIAPPKIYASMLDSLLDVNLGAPQVKTQQPLPRWFFLPIVYTDYKITDSIDNFQADYSGNPAMVWVEDAMALNRRMRALNEYVYFSDPTAVRYNMRTLPNPPKQFTAVVNDELHTIVIEETAPGEANAIVLNTSKGLIHWLHTFGATLQFSQAYVSPNWYQGGNNNINMITDLSYNIKLNQKLHPDLLFETNVKYRLGTNSAPDDSLRAYNISEDLLQVNSTFGLKAVEKWYYTVNAQFKTQLLNSYKKNSNNLKSAFMSPGELNFGIGMTFNTANKNKTFTLDASISPLSYNLMICTSDRIDHSSFNIDNGKTTSSKYGSSAEFKVAWKICSNVKLSSRLFAFSDYDRFYADFENTLVFEINKYLTSQVFAHLRYDSLTPYTDPSWHKLQIKEILSLGFAYKFSTL